MSKKLIAYKIFTVRYPNKKNVFFEEYIAKFGSQKDGLLTLFALLKNALEKPLPWGKYIIPETIKLNSSFFKKQIINIIDDFIAQDKITLDNIRDFFFTNHEIIKYALQRWILLNAGIAIELFTIQKENVEKNFLAELLTRGIKIGDEVIHLHVISNNERICLQQIGFDVPFTYWDKSYYTNALITINNLLQSNPYSIGLFCEDSWVFDPAIHHIASDGKPYASFSFLSDDRLTGERFFVGEAKPWNNYFKQFEFSLRSPRRKNFYITGEFIPKTYGIFYPKDKLRNSLIELGIF